MTTRAWWRWADAALVCAVLASGACLGLTAPSTSPVDDPRLLAPSAARGAVPPP